MYRSSAGKLRVDSGDKSVITDFIARRTVTLDHPGKEAVVAPLKEAAGGFGTGALAGAAASALPSSPPNVEDLGKSFIDGLEVTGKRFTFQPPSAPGLPVVPQAPTVSEVWTSTRLQLPVLTKTTGSFGEQTCRCKYTESAEPAPSLFEIPPDYRQVEAPASPEPPSLPQLPR
jgi:hypothetical protein